jgi:hypothetical protein
MSRTIALAAAATLALAFAAEAGDCMQFNEAGQRAEGRLSIGHFKDAADRPEDPYILTLDSPTCLDAKDADFRVEEANTIHVYSSDANLHRQFKKLVGRVISVQGHPFGAHTSHHHAPIVMDVSEIHPD